MIAKLYPSREVYEKEQTELLEEVIRKHHGEVQPGKGRKKIKGNRDLTLFDLFYPFYHDLTHILVFFDPIRPILDNLSKIMANLSFRRSNTTRAKWKDWISR